MSLPTPTLTMNARHSAYIRQHVRRIAVYEPNRRSQSIGTYAELGVVHRFREFLECAFIGGVVAGVEGNTRTGIRVRQVE